jgi:hypothetical protein
MCFFIFIYLFTLTSVVVWCVSAAGGVFRVPVLCVMFYRGCAVSGDGLGGGVLEWARGSYGGEFVAGYLILFVVVY